jgi:DNA processing protein
MLCRRNHVSLHVRGTWPEAQTWVALVGSRAATGTGLRRTRDLAQALAARGIVVVSGGALGIDAAAHEGALLGGGRTVAVLASLDHLYPSRNLGLFERIVEQGGALVTPPAKVSPVLPRPFRFLERNTAMAGLVDAVVVVEAQGSSGSLHTAQQARKLDKIVGAVSGSPGTELLLGRGAALVETADDLLQAIAGSPRRRELPRPADDSDCARALAVLSPAEARSVDSIAEAAGVGALRAQRALLSLELLGWALAAPGGRFLRAEIR